MVMLSKPTRMTQPSPISSPNALHRCAIHEACGLREATCRPAPLFQAASYRCVLQFAYFVGAFFGLLLVIPLPASVGLWRSIKPCGTSTCAMHSYLAAEALFKSRRAQLWSHFWRHGSSSCSHDFCPVVSPSWPTRSLSLHRLRCQSMLAPSYPFSSRNTAGGRAWCGTFARCVRLGCRLLGRPHDEYAGLKIWRMRLAVGRI